MKNNNWLKIILVSLVFVIFLQAQDVLAKEPQIWLENIDAIQLKKGETFSVMLKAKEIESLYGFEIALKFDDKKVQLKGKPSNLGIKGFTVGPTKASDGKVYFGCTQIGKGEVKSGDFDLATFEFELQEEGMTEIILESIKIVDADVKAKDYPIGQKLVVNLAKESYLKDVKGHWAENTIIQIVDKGYMVGKSANMFKPDDKLTRAETAAILSRIVQQDNVAEKSFKDIKGNEWYAKSVIKMAGMGLLKGYDDNTFKPTENITRTETMAIFARMIRKGQGDGIVENTDKILAQYKDALKIPAWAKQDIAWMVSKGLIKGDEKGNLNMQTNITRAEVATILYRLIETQQH